MQHPTRKITSEKYTITLPKEWREMLTLKPGDAMIPFFVSDSPLVIVPSTRPLSEFETTLVEMLLYGPTPEKARQLIDRLEIAKQFLESTILATS